MKTKIGIKTWILIIALIIAFILIFISFSPFQFLAFDKGVVIKSIDKNSSEFISGLRQGMIIESINSQQINNLEDYSKVINSLVFTGAEQKVIISTSEKDFIFFKGESLTIIPGEISKTKIKTGLDLSGGARALIKAYNKSLSTEELNDLIAITSERFNVYGLKDIAIRSVRDLQGDNYMLIEIAGATPSDLEDLISKQGEFEARIGNQTVFIGGTDISHVERSGQQSGIEGCYDSQAGQFCRFRFPISITEEAAKRQAELTEKLGISPENPEYLSDKLDLYLDGSLVDSLFISKDLKGRITTQILIQGSGSGTNREEAFNAATADMKKLQTVLITGSLPYKLEIVKLDTISPVLGKEFAKNLAYLAIVVFLIISAVIFIRYRKIKIASSVILTMFSEAFITLGFAALINWNLDAPSIAGIIAGMGTGVNDQIVILDESISNIPISLKQKIKNAFFIILGAFFTTFAAMVPLLWAGAGMLKGFAITTMATLTIGVLITRPAFAEILRKIRGE
jgi:preprotein translocase subunit SecD